MSTNYTAEWLAVVMRTRFCGCGPHKYLPLRGYFLHTKVMEVTDGYRGEFVAKWVEASCENCGRTGTLRWDPETQQVEWRFK